MSADKKKTYCLDEAPGAEAIRAAARRANVPVDVIVEVGELRPEMFGSTASPGLPCHPRGWTSAPTRLLVNADAEHRLGHEFPGQKGVGRVNTP
jgi:D-serine deaminase-like pyridoxal phosphate-dependent protein